MLWFCMPAPAVGEKKRLSRAGVFLWPACPPAFRCSKLSVDSGPGL